MSAYVPHRNRDGRIPTELPLPDYIEWAAERNSELYGDCSCDGDQFRSPMWEFVRFCVAHPKLRGLSATDAFRQISSAKLKSSRAFSWAYRFESDDPEAEFLATWDKVRVPAGEDILALAIALAKERLLHLRNCTSTKFALFVSIGGRLQELRPGNYINLPVRRLSEALGVEQRTISYYTGLATKHGYITRIARHHQPSGTAAKYEFHVERFNMKTGEELDYPSEHASYFHKDCKDTKDSEESEETNEEEMTGMTSKESKRQAGKAGCEFDPKRQIEKQELHFAIENASKTPSNRKDELRQQLQFLARRSK